MTGLHLVDLPPPDPRFVHGPSEACQLAMTWDEKPLTSGAAFVAEHKIDGVRCLWIDGEILSRELIPLECCDHLIDDFKRLEYRFGQRMMIDSEYQEPGGFLSTLSTVSSHGKIPGIGIATVFDAIPLEAWHAGVDPRAWFVRQMVLKTALPAPIGGLRLIDRRLVRFDQVAEVAEFVWAAGGEGLVLKDPDSPYIRGRSRAWQKVKRKLVIEAAVADVIMGGAAVSLIYCGRKLRATVPLNLRKDIAGAIGRSVTVEAMEFTDKGALRQGRVVHIHAVSQ